MPTQTEETTISPQGQRAAVEFAGDDAVILRESVLVPGSFNAEQNTVDVVFSTGARGLRYDWRTETIFEEELDVTTEAVDMSRIEAGVCHALNAHSTWDLSSIMGVATRAWISGGHALATLKLSSREEMRGYVQDIRDGIIRAISVGYRVEKWLRILPEARTDGGTRILMRAVRWTPHEISFVPVPFDMGSSTRSAGTDVRAPLRNLSGAPQVDGLPILDGATARHLLLLSEGRGAPPQSQALQEPQLGSEALSLALRLDGHQVSSAPAARAASTVKGPEMGKQTTEGGTAATTTTTTDEQQEGQQRAAATPGAAAGAPDAAQRAAEIVDVCTRHGVPNLAAQLIRDGKTPDEAATAVLAELARRDAAAGGHQNARGISTVSDETETRVRGLEEALQHRVDPKVKLTDNGRQYRGMSLLELGRDMLNASGVNTRGMDRMQLASRLLRHRSTAVEAMIERNGGMHTTSDFGFLLANVASKRLRNSYEENPGTYTRWARRAPNAPDFKTMSIVQMASMPDLVKVNEAGEFTYGTFSDGAETYALSTFGRIVTLSRQAIINDDLRGFDRLITGFGAAAARLENRTVYAQITANATMADGVALFHSSHGNLGTGGGSALAFDSLSSARTAMRLQKGLQSEELNLMPSTLIVPAALEGKAYQLTSSNYVPAKTTDVNEFRQGGRTAVEPVVEPLLDAVSATAWYAAASNSQVDTVEYCWLDGAEGPVIETETGFETDGISIKCREDFAAKVLDFRGLYKANGA